MKRFLLKLALFVSVHLALLAVAFGVYVKRFPPAESFYAASVDKHRLLETLPSPRLVFVGGSSMALGMDSALVARPLGFHPVNMGMNIGIGLESMLVETEPFLRPGDVVVLAPEYHSFQTHFRAEPEYLARLIECHPAMLRALRWTQLKELLDSGYVHHLGRIVRVVSGLGRDDRMFDFPVNQYNHRRAFNEHGDIVAHHGVQVARGSPLRFTFDSPETAEAVITRLNEFHRDCRRRGARVFYSHAPYERRYFESYRAAIDPLEALLKSRLTIPMLDTAEEMTFPSDQIFDVEYHLNLPGKLRRSERVAQSLRRALQGPPAPPP